MAVKFAQHDECGDWIIEPKILKNIKDKVDADSGYSVCEEEIECVILAMFDLHYIDIEDTELDRVEKYQPMMPFDRPSEF